ILFTLILGLPLLLAEFTIGRRGQANAVDSFKKIAPQTKWYGVGILGMVASLILLSFYSVIGGWFITYLYKVVTGGLHNLTSQQIESMFHRTISNPLSSVGAQFLFIVIQMIFFPRGI